MARLKTCCGCYSLEMGGFTIGILTIITCLTYFLWRSSKFLMGIDENLQNFRDFCLRNPFCNQNDSSCEAVPEDPSCCLIREICHALPGQKFEIHNSIILALELFAIFVAIIKIFASVFLLKDINEQSPRSISNFIKIDLISIATALTISIILNIVTGSPVLLVIFIIWMLTFGPIEVYIVIVLKSLKKKFESEQKRIEMAKEGTKV